MNAAAAHVKTMAAVWTSSVDTAVSVLMGLLEITANRVSYSDNPFSFMYYISPELFFSSAILLAGTEGECIYDLFFQLDI